MILEYSFKYITKFSVRVTSENLIPIAFSRSQPKVLHALVL